MSDLNATLAGYAELRCRTHYSFLRGASHPRELVERAAELGLAALAITDLDGVYGIPKAFVAAKKHPRLKLITGSELTLAGGRPPVTLLARDRAGYGVLCRLITASRASKPKGEAWLEWEELVAGLERSGAQGLIALAELPEVRHGGSSDHDGGHFGALRDLFGERVYLPLGRFRDGWDAERTRRALETSRRFGIPVLAVGDVHMHARERRQLQDVLTATRLLKPLSESGHGLFPNAERALRSPADVRRLFKDLPEAVDRTLEIAAQCAFSPGELRYRYPSEWIPPGETAMGYLTRLTWEGARWRYNGSIPAEVERQLRHELHLVEELSFADYFLTIWEVVEFAKKRDILCQGRGSAANSAICYCLGITAVDPVRMNLLFERFLSAERGEPPDIDVDFEHERREEVIQHIYEKYGRDRAGMVSAIINYRTRSAARDIGKALGIEQSVLEAGREAEKKAKEAGAPPPVHEDDLEVAAGMRLMGELRGFPRHLSIHSGGFTLSADPIIETVPIEPARMEGRTIVQWDKEDLAAIGLLKVDVLALGMLTAIQRTLKFVAAPVSGGRELTLATIPAEDPATYRMIQRADTVGVFQIESRAQMSMLPRLLPRTFYDLVVQVAIVRPGPIVGQMVHPYLRRRRGQEPAVSPDPRLEPILGRTLGVPLFQEQVMKMAITMAGFTPGEADALRRAIGAWRSSGEIDKWGRRLREGLLRSGLPEEFVERIFLQIQGFAEYGFPESHAASFALLAYASSYLKCHYPAEFAAALLNSQPMGFYSAHTIIDDAKRHGVEIRPLDPMISEWECGIEPAGESAIKPRGESAPASARPRALRVGWNTVRGVGETQGRRIVEQRRIREFAGLSDFVERAGLRPDVLCDLAMGGAFARFGFTGREREALWEILACHVRDAGEDPGSQLDLFSGAGETSSVSSESEGGDGRVFRPLSEYQAIRSDYRTFGLSTRGHPMGALRRALGTGAQGRRRIPSTTAQAARRAPDGRNLRLAGMVIVRQRPHTAKGTTFATLEDETGFLDLILHRDVYEKYREDFLSSPFLVMSGRLQRDGEHATLIVRKVERFEFGSHEVDTPDSSPRELAVVSRDFH